MAAIPDPDFGGNRVGRSGRDGLILVVSDQRHILRLIQVNMERAGYRVALASNEKDALTQIANEPPDLVILDMAMLQTDVLKELRTNPKTQARSVVLLAKSENDISIGRHYQVAGAVVIPFDPRELVALIRRLLKF